MPGTAITATAVTVTDGAIAAVTTAVVMVSSSTDSASAVVASSCLQAVP